MARSARAASRDLAAVPRRPHPTVAARIACRTAHTVRDNLPRDRRRSGSAPWIRRTVSNKRREDGYDRHIRSGDIGYRRPCDNPESATRGRRGRAADARTTRPINRRPRPRPRPARAATGRSHRGRNRAHPRGHRVHRTLRHRPPHPRLDTSRTGRTRLPPQPPGRPPHPNPPPTHNTNQPNQPDQPAPAGDTRPGRRRRPHPPTHRSERRGRHGWAPTRTDSAHGNRRPTHHDRTCLTPASPIGVAGHAAIPQPVRAVTGNPAAAAVRLPGLITDCALRRRSARRTPRRGAHRRQVAPGRQVGQTSGWADVRVGRGQEAVTPLPPGSRRGHHLAEARSPKPARPLACHVERTPGVSSATGHRARPADPRPHPRQRPSPAHSRTVTTGRFPVARPQPTATATRPGENRSAPTIPIHATTETGGAVDRPPPLRPLPGPRPQPGDGVAVDLEPDRGIRYRRWAARRPRVERALVRVDPDGDQGCFRSPVMGSPATGNLTSGLITPVEPRRQRATAGATRWRPLPFPPDVGEPGSPGFEIRCRGGHLLVGHPREQLAQFVAGRAHVVNGGRACITVSDVCFSASLPAP